MLLDQLGSSSLRVLIVDDNPNDFHRLESLLTTLTPASVVTPAETLSAALDSTLDDFDLCVLALDLPDSQGIETMDRVTAEAPALPLVVRSTGEDPDLARAALAHGALDILPPAPSDASTAGSIVAAARRSRMMRTLGVPLEDFKTLIEVFPDALLVVTPQGKTLFANGRAAALLERPAAEMIDGIPGDLWNVTQTEDTRYLRPDGSPLLLQTKSSAIRWMDRPARLVRLTNVTEQRRRESRAEHMASVHRAVRRVYQTLSSEPDPLQLLQTVCDLLRTPDMYQEAWVAFGTEHSEIPPVQIFQGSPACSALLKSAFAKQERPHCYKAALATERPHIIDRDDACRSCPIRNDPGPHLSVVTALRHGGKTFGVLGLRLPPHSQVDEEERLVIEEIGQGLAAALYDIEQRKRTQTAELALREAESEFRSVTDGIPVMLAYVDADARLRVANRAFADWTGSRKEDLVGKPLEELTAGRIGAALKEHHDNASDGEPSSFHVQAERDGRPRTLEVKVIPREQRRSESGYFLVAQDITDNEALQSKMAQADRLASVGLLASGVAHEINNPLTYILHCAQRLEKDLPLMLQAAARLEERGPVPAELSSAQLEGAVQNAKWVGNGARRVRDVIRRLSTFARGDDHGVSAVDVNAVVESALQLVEGELRYRARVVRRLGVLPTIVSNAGQLGQVVLNLLLNATQAIEEGRADENEVNVHTWQNGEDICIQLSDTGCGISAENLRHVFDPFFSTKDTGATGLGLSIANNIARSIGATISAESEPGLGTIFTITVPIDKAKRPSDAVKGERPAQKPRLLIVDDEPVLTMILSKALDHLFQVTRAHSGGEAKRLVDAAKVTFDAIVCDIMMPDGTGAEVYNHMLSQHPSLTQKMVFITGGAFTARTKAFLESVDNPRLEKPFAPLDLLPLIRNVMDNA